MRFCKDCGAVLNLFTDNEKELCSTCIQHQKKQSPAPVPRAMEEGPDLLADAILICENDKLILRSKEGWELWSCPVGSPVTLQTMMARAGRIYEIRLKRQKN